MGTTSRSGEDARDGRGARPAKKSSDEICREMGYVDCQDFLAKYFEQNIRLAFGDGDTPADTFQTQLFKPGEIIDPEEFLVHAFPEFPPDAPKRASLNGARGAELGGHTIEWYIKIYERTYRHHYEMQDDWLAIITDPEFEQFTGITAASRHENSPWLEHPIDFETFERVMLCVADDDYWAGNVREPWASLDGSVVSTWICRWRRRLGCPVVKGVDDNPWFHKVVWRDNWRDVREAVVGIAKRDFPPIEETGESFDADASVEGALLGLAERLAGRFGLTEEHGSTKCMFGWTFTTWLVARDIADMPWHEYIEARSGRKWDVSGGDFPL
nr:hypothetical protein [Candidatus Sigynarchaeum springense]